MKRFLKRLSMNSSLKRVLRNRSEEECMRLNRKLQPGVVGFQLHLHIRQHLVSVAEPLSCLRIPVKSLIYLSIQIAHQVRVEFQYLPIIGEETIGFDFDIRQLRVHCGA